MLQEEACTVELYLVKDENNHQRVLCGALLAITMRHQCSMLSPLTTRWSVGATPHSRPRSARARVGRRGFQLQVRAFFALRSARESIKKQSETRSSVIS
jgi:hypothetical protein